MAKFTQNIILFDLDGTLTDSAEGIVRSAQYMQEKMGMPIWQAEDLHFMVGPPLRESFRDGFGMNETQIEQGILYFRERYFSVGLFENAVYDGIKETLQTLCDMGKRLAVATSKHQSTALRILEHFGLTEYFEIIGGDDNTSTRNTKAKVIAYVMEEMQADPKDIIMVGDRKYDIEGAHEMGISAIGVLYGYGSMEEFNACGADGIAKTPKDIVSLFT